MTKAVQFRQDNGKLSVHEIVFVQTPKGLVENGAVKSIDKLAALLSQIRLKKNWQNNLVNFCLNPQAFYLSITRMPAMAKKDLKMALQLEAENQFPLSPGEFSYSFCPLYSASNSREESDYILVAANKMASLAFSKAAAIAGFVTSAIDIEPFALIRKPAARNHLGLENDPTCSLVLNLGFQSSTVLITNNHYFSYCRSIRFGIEDFINAISASGRFDSFMVSDLLFNREAMKHEPVKQAANQMLVKLKQTLDYWQEQDSSQGQFPGSLHICGGGTLIPGLPALIGSSLAIKPAPYNPVLPLNAIENLNTKKQFQYKALLAVACGLALRGWVR